MSELSMPSFESTPIPVLDAGAYPARLLSLATLGLQEQRPYKGEQKDPAVEVMFTFEILGQTITINDEEQPRIISRRAKFVGGDRSNFTKWVKALDPDGSKSNGYKELSGLLGLPCQVEVQVYQDKDNNDRNGMGNLTQLMAGFEAPEMQMQPFIFNFDQPEWEDFQKLPRWVQNACKNALNFEDSALQRMVQELETTDDEENGSLPHPI